MADPVILRPAEVRPLNEREREVLAKIAGVINDGLRRYEGQPLSISIAKVDSRVWLRLRELLEASGWRVEWQEDQREGVWLVIREAESEVRGA